MELGQMTNSPTEKQPFTYNEATLLKIKNVAKLIDVSVTTIWRYYKEEGFPSPIRIGPQSVRWRLSEIVEWQKRMAEEAYKPATRKPSPGRPRKNPVLKKRAGKNV